MISSARQVVLKNQACAAPLSPAEHSKSLHTSQLTQDLPLTRKLQGGNKGRKSGPRLIFGPSKRGLNVSFPPSALSRKRISRISLKGSPTTPAHPLGA